VLLHIIEVNPVDGSDPIHNYELIEKELGRYSQAIADKPRWLALSKADAASDVDVQLIVDQLETQAAAKAQKIFVISSVTGSGIDALIGDLGQFLLDQTEETQTRQKALEQRAGQEAHDYSLLLREARRKRRQIDEDDDHEVNVHYER
jgi:GTP-binding protein